MANIYYYRVSGIEPLQEVKIYANNEKHADYKIATTIVNGRKFYEWQLVKVEKLDDKPVV